MSFVKSLWTDLVEKRLWPVALVLLLALVAVPVALGGSNDDAAVSVAPGATGATGAPALTAQAALEVSLPVRRDRTGMVRDPFKQLAGGGATGEAGTTSITAPPLTKEPSTGGGSTDATGIEAPPLTKTPSTGGGTKEPTPAKPTEPTTPTTPDQTTPAPPKQAAPAPSPLDSYEVTLVFGETGTKRARETLDRLTPLPSAKSPFLVYLGVLSDEKTAVFLVSSDAKATGEGACKPRPSSCETVELRRGDTEYFAVTGEDGKVTWYQLDFGHVVTKSGDTPSPATKASAQDDLGSDRYAYDDATGLLRRVKGSAAPRSDPRPTEGALRRILRAFRVAEEAVAREEPLPGALATPGS